ncbi:MAG TPA: lipoate--protein ligase [Erysipelotrichaceae bacterium]|nr:lipoate--protein ligase [Erysipelotrichaceae bacterium]
MISSIYYLETDCLNPYENLAMEEYLTDALPVNSALLFLWQNRNCVVIGKNQNSYDECNLDLMKSDEVKPVRRKTGGGAVYHDLGNLNFSFITDKKHYSKESNNQIIINALKRLDITAEISGRNDLVIRKQKFSGHAYLNKRNCLHHGTLMVDVDKNKLAKYLTVSKEKLSGKHVSSVKSRVINLKEVNEKLTVEELKKALLESFEDYYQLSVETIVIDADRIKQLTQQYQKAEFIYGKNSSCSFHKSCRFVWGVVKISYSLKDNRISELEIASDCLDSSLPEEMQAILLNKQLDKNLYSYSERTEYQDIINLLLQEEYL